MAYVCWQHTRFFGRQYVALTIRVLIVLTWHNIMVTATTQGCSIPDWPTTVCAWATDPVWAVLWKRALHSTHAGCGRWGVTTACHTSRWSLKILVLCLCTACMTLNFTNQDTLIVHLTCFHKCKFQTTERPPSLPFPSLFFNFNMELI